MTLEVALTISSTRTVDLWRLCVDEHAGWSPDSLRETALDLLTTEVERLVKVAGEALGTDPDLRGSGCVDALAAHVETLRAELAAAHAALDILTEEVLRLQAELDAAGPQERDTMTNPDLDRALAAADANVGPSALDTLAREVRRLQTNLDATNATIERLSAALAALQQGQADLTQRLADIHVVAGQHVGVTDLRIGPSLDDWNHLERLSRPALAAWRARQKGTPT